MRSFVFCVCVFSAIVLLFSCMKMKLDSYVIFKLKKWLGNGNGKFRRSHRVHLNEKSTQVKAQTKRTSGEIKAKRSINWAFSSLHFHSMPLLVHRKFTRRRQIMLVHYTMLVSLLFCVSKQIHAHFIRKKQRRERKQDVEIETLCIFHSHSELLNIGKHDC